MTLHLYYHNIESFSKTSVHDQNIVFELFFTWASCYGNGKSRTELNAVQEKLLAAGARGGGRKEESIASWVRERSFTRRCYTKQEPKVTHSCPVEIMLGCVMLGEIFSQHISQPTPLVVCRQRPALAGMLHGWKFLLKVAAAMAAETNLLQSLVARIDGPSAS